MLDFAIQMGSYEVSGDDEKDVHADVAAAEPVGPQVVQDNSEYGNCPKPLDLRLEL